MFLKKQSVLNLFLRGLSMAARFILIFYLGKYFSLDELGSYGIFFTTVTLSLFLLGLDFYTFANREVLNMKQEDRLTILRNQLVFYGFTYVVFLLPLLLIFYYNVLPLEYLFFFYFILIFEHISQEFYRLFTVLSFPVFANWLLFLRTGLWVYLLALGWLLFPGLSYSLSLVFWGWLIGSGLSVIIGFIKIIHLHKGSVLKPLDIKWFIPGLKVSMLYFGGTIALKIIEFSNRYMLEYWCSMKAVGIYTFFSQIANMINIVIFTLFFMVIYPKLLTAVNENNTAEREKLKKLMMNKTLLYSAGLAILLVIIIKPVLYIINKTDFDNEMMTFYFLILSNVALNISFVYHYILYAFKKDTHLLIATVVSAIVNIILNVVLINFWSISGAAFSVFASYAVLAMIKWVYAGKAEKENIILADKT